MLMELARFVFRLVGLKGWLLVVSEEGVEGQGRILEGDDLGPSRWQGVRLR
jgi:hypothetical protein